MRHQLVLFVLAASTALTGCGRVETEATLVDGRLTVAGSHDGVERFAKLQGSRRPALAMSATTPLGNGRAEATVTLPASYDAQDLVHTTREALAAGLDYRFEARRSGGEVRS